MKTLIITHYSAWRTFRVIMLWILLFVIVVKLSGGAGQHCNARCLVSPRTLQLETTPELLEVCDEIVQDRKLLEDGLAETCAWWGVLKPTLIKIPVYDLEYPFSCSTVTICTPVYCLVLGRLSSVLTKYVPVLDLSTALFNRIENMAMSSWETLNGKEYKALLNATCTECNIVDGVSTFSKMGVDFKNFTKNMIYVLSNWEEQARWKCLIDWYNDTIRNHVVVNLPDLHRIGCFAIGMCTATDCMIYPPMAIALGSIFKRGSCTLTNCVSKSPICSASQIPSLRRRRRFPVLPQNRTRLSLGLSFNLPFHRYCGAGTDVLAADDAGGPLGILDTLCRQHDIDYMLGMDPVLADEIFLQGVYEKGSFMYPAINALFKAKKYFEEMTGKAYTSSLYYVPSTVAATTAHNFYFHSVYENLNEDQITTLGKSKEERWVEIVHDIWRGACYIMNTPLDPDTDTARLNPSPPLPQQAVEIPQDVKMVDFDSTQEGLDSAATVAYPVPPALFTSCRVVINELRTADTVSKESFLELAKVCPSNIKRNRAKSLKGYAVVLLRLSSPEVALMSYEFTTSSLTEITEKFNVNYYFVIGNTVVLQRDVNLFHCKGRLYEFPQDAGETYAIVLIYNINKLRAAILNERLPYNVAEEDIEFLSATVQDVLVYGAPCDFGRCRNVRQWMNRAPRADDSNDPLAIAVPSVEKNGLSINRCIAKGEGYEYPMQQGCWHEAVQSPKQQNQCPIVVAYPYSFERQPIQSTAQKIVMNVNAFVTAATATGSFDPSFMEGTTHEVVSRITGVSTAMVSKIKHREATDSIVTPSGHKRKRICRSVSRFDGFSQEIIKRVVRDIFMQNIPPTLDRIYEESKRRFAAGNETTFSQYGLRKLLKAMGFKYGRLNNREVLLQRPDIVRKRITYLRNMKANDELGADRLPVVYTDETWVDVHKRTGKAWIPRADANMDKHERLKYNYQRHKPNRGPRLIVIHAGHEENGLIHTMSTVYAVGGKKTAEDYHDNVNSDVYYEWFTKLCQELQEKGPHIIVIDNAPYHTKSLAPKSGDKKQTMLDFLIAEDPSGEITGFNSTVKYLKPELWDMVKDFRDKMDNHYVIDNIAKQYGHKVERLPPYNCDLNPIEGTWKDGKHYLEDNNVDQNIKTLEETLKTYFALYTPDQFAAHVRHTDKLRKEYWLSDNAQDEFMERSFVISIRDEDHDDEEDDDVQLDDIHSSVHDGDEVYVGGTEQEYNDPRNPARKQLIMCAE